MDFKRLRHFVHIAELGSLSAAAKRLNIVQPALTLSLKKLEQDLETKLFIRSRSGMELTEAGELFLESAYGILNQYDRAKENISAPALSPVGTVRVAMIASALHVLSVPLCRLLKAELPRVELILEEGLAANIQSGFEAGRYDLVVSYMHEASSATKAVPLIKEDMYLSEAFDKKQRSRCVRFKELSRFKLILPHTEHGLRSQIGEHDQKDNVQLNWDTVSATLYPTLALVEAGIGSSLLPWAAVFDRVENKQLTCRKVVEPTVSHSVSMIYPTNRPRTRATIAIMDLIKRAIQDVNSDGKWPGKLLFEPAE